jgi:hypothetical protein
MLATVSSARSETIGGNSYEISGGEYFLVDSDGEQWRIVRDLIEIKFDEGVSTATQDSFITAIGLTDPEITPLDDYRLYQYPSTESPLDVLSTVLAWTGTVNAVLDFEAKALGDPHFTFDKQWNGYLVNLDRALQVTTGNAEVLVAINDGGVDKDHEDLSATVWTNPIELAGDHGEDDDDDESWFGRKISDDLWGWNFRSIFSGVGDVQPWPVTNHGTPVASVLVAVTNNDVGLASPGGGSTVARPIRWLSVIGQTTLTIPCAVEYSLQKGAKIINQSFRVTNQDFGSRIPTREACRRFAQSGGLIFAGAGNDCENESNPFIEVPARVDSVVAVGAVDSLLSVGLFLRWT